MRQQKITAANCVLIRHWTDSTGKPCLRPLSLSRYRAGIPRSFDVCVRRETAPPPLAVEHCCSEGATSDRPRSISCFAGGTHEAFAPRLPSDQSRAPDHPCSSRVLPPTSVPITHAVSICFSAHGTRGRSACRPESVERLIVLRVAIGPLCSQVSFRPPEARWSRNPACVWLHSRRQSEYIRAAVGRSHDNLPHIRS
jgi:hypothetical protein